MSERNDKSNFSAVENETDEDFMTRITQPRVWTIFKLDFVFQLFTDERLDEVLEMFKVIILYFYDGYNCIILLYYLMENDFDTSDDDLYYFM